MTAIRASTTNAAAPALLERLKRWVDAGALRALDLALAQFVHQETGTGDNAVLLAVALTSERNGHGHVCLDLVDALAHPERLLTRLRDDGDVSPVVRAELKDLLKGLTVGDWVARLGGNPAICDQLNRRDDGVAPLVLAGRPEQPLLYLRRYWRYETQILAGIKARLEQEPSLCEDDLRLLLGALFPCTGGASGESLNWQKIACAVAGRRAFAIITGGPGTGKTTTVVRLLALLQGLRIARGDPPLRIRLAAPTGKAAARLNASIADRINSLALDALADGEQLRAAIPTEATTLHRLLGSIPESRRFRHHAGHPLPADVVVVDEASMVDVEMMAHLLEALRPDARLVLLGDKDQLASVEAGAVLGDLCQRAREAHYDSATCEWLQQVTGMMIPEDRADSAGRSLDQAVVMLREGYRFRPEGGIGALAKQVNESPTNAASASDRAKAVLDLFKHEEQRGQTGMKDLGRVAAIAVSDPGDRAFADLVCDGYRGYLSLMRTDEPGVGADQPTLDTWARAVLDAHGAFQLLAALRQGPWGVEGLNHRIIELLSADGLLGLRSGVRTEGLDRQWLPGRPVLVTRNDYSLNLMNGDIGITLQVPARPGDASAPVVLRVAFPAGDGSGGIRWILPSRLQAVETVFAMTVHKSQGSEFDHAALVLPD